MHLSITKMTSAGWITDYLSFVLKVKLGSSDRIPKFYFWKPVHMWAGQMSRIHVTQINQIKKFYLKSVHFISVQHKLSRAFQTDMHNKLHKLNTAQ
jgi:hypothetical protein